MRFNRPAGILLLWLPTAWALWIVNQGIPAFNLVICFLSGTIVMRAAGCIVNDIADRHIDKHVKRTNMRPITTGEVGLPEAMVLLTVLLVAALYIVMQLPIVCLYYAFAALFITILYPFCKRFFEAPQLVLGLAFSMGIPMAYAASGVVFTTTMIVLFMQNFAWIVSYDTMYAMADREDDLRIGVKSTAIFFADYDQFIILLLQIIVHTTWLYLASRWHFSLWFYGFWSASLVVLVYQQWLISQRTNTDYLKAFSSNVLYGVVMWCALIVGFGRF